MPTQNAAIEIQYSHEDLLIPECAAGALYDSIVAFDNKNLLLAISYLKKTSFDLHKPLDEDSQPVLMTAIHFENQYAVEQLLKSGLVDVRAESRNGMNALYYAAFNTNLPILNLLYSRDTNINDVSYGTPLIKALTQVRGYTLIHDSNWGSDKNKKKMISWYEGMESLPGELDINTKYTASHAASFEINWKGGLEMAKYLLERGANPKIAISNNSKLDAEFIINNPSSPECLKQFDGCDDTFKFDSEKNGILSFYTMLKNRRKKNKIYVKVNFDPREIRELINLYVKKLVDKHAPQKQSFKEWDEERLNKLAHEVNAAASHASTATALAIGAHAKADTLKAVVNNNGAVLAHTIGRVDKNETEIKTLFEDYSPLKAMANIERDLKNIRSNPAQNAFYENLFKQIDTFIVSNLMLQGGRVQNSGYSIAHKIAGGIEALAGKIPIVGIASGLISKGISKAADIYESRKWERVYHLAPADHVSFSKELSLEVTKAYSAELNQIGLANSTQSQKAIELSLKLAKKAGDFIINSMSDTKIDKNKGVPQNVIIEEQASKLKHDAAFKKQLEKCAPSTPVATTMVAREVYSSKGHSPVKFTVMVTNPNVSNQPLPGHAASAKPTPPLVPARPPLPVAFSSTNPGISAKALQAVGDAQMAVSSAAAASRKIVPSVINH